jgi:hypothetical protein
MELKQEIFETDTAGNICTKPIPHQGTTRMTESQTIDLPSVWIPSETPIHPASATTTLTYTGQEEEEEDYFEMKSEKEIREFLTEIFLWFSRMGKYPEKLEELCSEEIVTNEIKEKTVIQILRWVLGEI